MAPAASEGPAWPELHRERRTIVVVDVVESVRLMQKHEGAFIDCWRGFVNEVRGKVLPAHGGRLVKSLGDGMLLEFTSVPEAVAAALEVRRIMARIGCNFDSAEGISLRIGIHQADVVIDDLDVYGSGVNLASRVAALAQPSQIVLTAQARDALVPSLDGELHDIGECYVKHMTEPVRCFVVDEPDPALTVLPPPLEEAFAGPALAVLPLDAVGEPGAQSIGEAVATELVSLLSRSHRIRVISPLSSRALAARSLSCAQIGTRLGARYLVSGSLACVGERVSITLQLSDTTSSNVVWSDVVRMKLRDVLDPEAGGLPSIVAAMMDAIDKAEVEKARTLPLPTLHSYTLLIGGVMMMHRVGAADFARARKVLEFLADRTGRHPLPKAWLAKWHVLNVQQGWSPDAPSDAAAALRYTAAALDADPGCSLAHTMEGFARANILRDFDGAASCYAHALDVNPSDSLAWLLKGMLHAFRDEGAEAIGACDRALGLSPLDPLRYFYDALAASAALTAGDYGRAVSLARRSLRLNRSHLSTHRALTAALALAGHGAEAQASASELLARDPGFTVSGFLARTPGRGSGTSARIAAALKEAGIPE